MSTFREYRSMPSDNLKAALEWLREEVCRSGTDGERRHAYNLINELNDLMGVWRLWYFNECYRDFTRERNALAKKLFAENFGASEGEDIWGEKMRRCLAAADMFLKISGEKVKKAEEIKERLCKVLGWKP